MQHKDFGQLDGPVVLFGGPYSNFQATRAMLDVIAGRDAVCTGDVVGYCANPNETVALMDDAGIPCVAGKCEKRLVEGADNLGCGFEDGSARDLLSRGWYPFALVATTPDMVAGLAVLPDIASFTHRGRRYGVIHGGATTIDRFLWPSSPEEDFMIEINAIEDAVGHVDGVVAGRSGIAFHARIGRYQWINAGAIGLPPHDGRPETRYAVLSDGDVMIERLVYDHAAARAAMEDAGLIQGYHETLSTGLWPSEDILPQELRN